MRQGLYLFFFFFLVFTGCNDKDSDNAIIPKLKMQAIINDLMKADQFISDFRVPTDTVMNRDVESIKLYQQVFSIHGITKTQFEQSLTYYQSRPDLLKAMMDSISKPPVVAPTPTTSPKDTNSKRVLPLSIKDSIILTKDSLLRKKKIPVKNN
jgi:hypothetical protein